MPGLRCLMCPVPVGMIFKCVCCIIDLVIWPAWHHRLHVVLCTHEKQVVMSQFLLFAEVESSLV